MDIGDRIKALRNEKGLTLKELGERIGMSVSFLSDVENSRSYPSLKRCKQIAAGLNVPVSILLGEEASDGSNTISSSTPEAKCLSELLYDFDEWTDNDKNELLSYLEAKKAVRAQGKQKK